MSKHAKELWPPPGGAAELARHFGYLKAQFVRLALPAQIKHARLKLDLYVEARQ